MQNFEEMLMSSGRGNLRERVVAGVPLVSAAQIAESVKGTLNSSPGK